LRLSRVFATVRTCDTSSFDGSLRRSPS
jgi:hypothetical protein